MRNLPDTVNGVPRIADTFTREQQEEVSENREGQSREATCDRRVGDGRRAAASTAAKARWSRRRPIGDVLRSKVDRRELSPGGCWPFTGGKDKDGYGHLTYAGTMYQAHKVALELRLGRPLQPGEVSRHICIGSKACCNADHMIPGTVADNNRDTLEAGRVPSGEDNPGAVLTAAQVQQIRGEAKRGNYEALGRRYGVTGKTISNIARGLKWKAALAAAVSQ